MTTGEIIIYQPEDIHNFSIEVRVEDETVWLTQLQMAELFEATKQNISLHINNIFKEKELYKDSVVKYSLTTASDGKRYNTAFYNLDVIISVGYRVKSLRGTQFRIWANSVLKDYLLKGYAINQRINNLERKVNELSKIFNLMGIDTHDVLDAAGTKWNFLPFKPGLVGGHCIGVDPFYLAQKAQEYGYNPEIILAGRRMNDSMGEYVAEKVVKLMLKKGIQVLGSDILVLGFTFKENCPDVRNTKVIDIVRTLQDYNVNVHIYDPWANPAIAKHEYGVELQNELPNRTFDGIVMAVAHQEFETLDISSLINGNSVVYDVKGVMNNGFDGKL